MKAVVVLSLLVATPSALAADDSSTQVRSGQRSPHSAVPGIAKRLAWSMDVMRDTAPEMEYDLANESFRSGKISLFAYTTLRRDLVAARLDYLDALADVAEREFALAAATGLPLGDPQ